MSRDRSKSRAAFALLEAGSLRRMVATSRKYGGALQIRDESGALDKARAWIRVAREWREGARGF